MKIKSILSIAAFSTAFIISAAFAALFVDKSEIETVFVITPSYNTKATSCFGRAKGLSSANAASINHILQTDDANGWTRYAKTSSVSFDNKPPFAKDSSFDVFADATARYAEQSGKIEIAGLSPEFTSAWRTHMKAWRDYSDFLEAMKISSVRLELGADALLKFEREYDDEISRSWREVLRVADQSGVNTQKYR